MQYINESKEALHIFLQILHLLQLQLHTAAPYFPLLHRPHFPLGKKALSWVCTLFMLQLLSFILMWFVCKVAICETLIFRDIWNILLKHSKADKPYMLVSYRPDQTSSSPPHLLMHPSLCVFWIRSCYTLLMTYYSFSYSRPPIRSWDEITWRGRERETD